MWRSMLLLDYNNCILFPLTKNLRPKKLVDRYQELILKERDSVGKTHVWNNILQFHASIELFGGQTWHLVKQIFEDIWDCRLKKKVYIDIKLNFIKIRYLYSSSWDKCRRISISFAINSGGYFYSKLKKVPFLFKKCTHSGGWHHQSSVLPLLARQQNKVPLSILPRAGARAIWGENCRGCEGPGWLQA